VRTALVIGIGAGSPDHLTLQAVAAIGRADAFLLLDKGTAAGLAELRELLIRTYGRPEAVTIVVPDPPRDRSPADYDAEVAAWHHARAHAIGRVLEGLPPDATVAFLVWGDPSLYDSTLRVLERVGGLAVEVVPGITAVQALTAAHATTLNRVGAPVTITTGRRVSADGMPADDVVVMLDGGSAWSAFPDAEVMWGANVGTADEVLIRGRVAEVGARITEAKAAVRERAGWVMDVYLLRRP
jgi:precorrin-6A synthase